MRYRIIAAIKAGVPAEEIARKVGVHVVYVRKLARLVFHRITEGVGEN